MSVEQWLMTDGSDLVKVLFGLDALNSNVVHELAQLVDDGSGRLITVDVLEWDQGEGKWKAVPKQDQRPPFKSQGELAYDLFKRAETAAWWLISPAISVVYCVDGFVAGDRTRIALLAKLSDMVGRGTYKGPVLSWENTGWVAVLAHLQRYGVCGLFYNHKPENVEGLLKLAQAPDAHHRYTALWALSQIATVPEFGLRIKEALESSARDSSSDVREFAEKTLKPTRATQPTAPAQLSAAEATDAVVVLPPASRQSAGSELAGDAFLPPTVRAEMHAARAKMARSQALWAEAAQRAEARPPGVVQQAVAADSATIPPLFKALLVVLGIGLVTWIVLKLMSIV